MFVAEIVFGCVFRHTNQPPHTSTTMPKSTTVTIAAVAACMLHSVNGLRFLPEHARGGRVAAEHPELLPPVFAASDSSSKAYTLSVPLDHFNSSDTRVFEDHYFVDDSCWDREVCVCVCAVCVCVC